ncbi:hypothetical protein Hanom_Chr08g00756201 [Helianthus anomalus]
MRLGPTRHEKLNKTEENWLSASVNWPLAIADAIGVKGRVRRQKVRPSTLNDASATPRCPVANVPTLISAYRCQQLPKPTPNPSPTIPRSLIFFIIVPRLLETIIIFIFFLIPIIHISTSHCPYLNLIIRSLPKRSRFKSNISFLDHVLAYHEWLISLGFTPV